MTDAPVIITRVVRDEGPTASWYISVGAAECHNPVIVASRFGVMVFTYITSVPEAWIAAAMNTYARLKANSDADLSGLATHEHTVTSNGPIKPITREDV